MEIIDDATHQRFIERFGPRVTEWCEELPTQLDRLTRKWSIQIDRSSSRGSHSCLLLCRLRSGERAVLKLSPDRTFKSFPPLIQRVEFIFELRGAQLQKPKVASHASQEVLKRSLAKARELAARTISISSR